MEKGGLSGNCTHLVTKGGSGETDRHRGDREGDKEVETDVRDKETKVGEKEQLWFKKTPTVYTRGNQKLPQSQSPFQEGPAEGTVASFCPRVRAGTWST